MDKKKEKIEQMISKLEKSGKYTKEQIKDMGNLATKVFDNGMIPKDAMGLTDDVVEGIYAYAYRLYNTGKYEDASELFRLLILLNPTEGKFPLGLGACYHMMKKYNDATMCYSMSAVVDPENPLPYFYQSDCYLKMKDKKSAYAALKLALNRTEDRPEYATLKDKALLTIKGLEKDLGLIKKKKTKKEG